MKTGLSLELENLQLPEDFPLPGIEGIKSLFKWQKNLLALFNKILCEGGRTRLDSRLLRLIKDKGYVERLQKHGLEQDPDRNYCPAKFKKGTGRAIEYTFTEIPTGHSKILKVLRFFVSQPEKIRKAILSQTVERSICTQFMPKMREFAKANGITGKKISLKYGNYYGAGAQTKLSDWPPGIVEIDVHAMNPFSMGQLCAPEEWRRYYSLFQGRGFYENLWILSGAQDCEPDQSLEDFKQEVIQSLNRHDISRLVKRSDERQEELNAWHRDQQRKELLKKFERPRTAREKSQKVMSTISGKLGTYFGVKLEPSSPISFYEPSGQNYSLPLTWLAETFPVMWRKFLAKARALGSSKLSTEFFLPHQGMLCGLTCADMEERSIGVCQKHDAIYMRIEDVPAVATQLREHAQAHFGQQPVLHAKASEGTCPEAIQRLKELRPDLFERDNAETLDPTDYWPELRLQARRQILRAA